MTRKKWQWERELKRRGVAEGLTPTAHHIALTLATYADADGQGIRPSYETLTRVTGRSRGTVADALKRLRDTGWIVQVSKGSGTTRRASVYRLSIPSGANDLGDLAAAHESEQEYTSRPVNP
ncbi:MAG: helix-turn-helix domain-containing protein [Comamonadaceae bacterium]|nr:MAG: helix-turn-helix domain-containing protein [Comamonadaceae bacterium]